MTRLSEIPDRMTIILNDLGTVMGAEQQQLSAGHINGSQLQHITKKKSSLLTTLGCLEQQRYLEHDATRSISDEVAECRQTVAKKTRHLRDLSQHNGWLLEGQIKRNQQVVQVLKPHQEPMLYSANGQTSAMHRGGRRFFI